MGTPLELSTNDGFVVGWKGNVVFCYMIDEGRTRKYEKYPLFHGVNLFTGMQFHFDIKITPGIMVTTCIPSKEPEFDQIYNYLTSSDYNQNQ